MPDRLIPADDHDFSTVPNVDRDMLLDTLPRFVRDEGAVTVKDCVEGILLADRTPPSEEARVAASVQASNFVRQGLDWLVERDYLRKTRNDKGHLLYSAPEA